MSSHRRRQNRIPSVWSHLILLANERKTSGKWLCRPSGARSTFPDLLLEGFEVTNDNAEELFGYIGAVVVDPNPGEKWTAEKIYLVSHGWDGMRPNLKQVLLPIRFGGYMLYGFFDARVAGSTGPPFFVLHLRPSKTYRVTIGGDNWRKTKC